MPKTRDWADGPERRFEDWNRELGALIDDLDSPELARLAWSAPSAQLVPFELAAVFVYRGRSRPLEPLRQLRARRRASKGIAAYVENTYVLNPFYPGEPEGAGRRSLPHSGSRARRLLRERVL